MIRTKALRKIFTTTLTLFILLTVYLIPKTETKNVLKTNLEMTTNTNIGTNIIYLLNDNNYLVKTKILLSSTKKEDQIKEIIENLTKTDNQKFPSSLKSTIPESTNLKEVIYSNKIVTLDFSKEILKVEEELEKQMISSIVYSVIDLKDIDGVSIMVEGESLTEYPNSHEKLDTILTKKIGINKKYNINSRENIEKVVIYYLEEIDNNMYYVPVTKYLNDSREKIEIIVDELSSSYIYEPNLMSFLNNNTKLLDFEEKENVMFLNFNKYLFGDNDKLLEEVAYTIAYSVFDNYDVNVVLFEVNNEKVEQITINDLP